MSGHPRPHHRNRFAVEMGVSRVTAVVALLLLSSASSCPQKPDPALPQAKLLTANAKNLAETTVTADLNEPITPGTNLVWCATMPLAWNEMVDLVGQKIDFLDDEPDPPSLAALNDRAVSKSVLDDPSYMALAGLVRDGILDTILQTKAARFPDATLALPELPPLEPTDFIAYAYLLKNLLFTHKFEVFPDRLNFAGVDVLAFGVTPGSALEDAVRQQVIILDYNNDDDFVIELKTQSEVDQVILAKIQPAATLEATIQAVLARSAGGSQQFFLSEDVLEIPTFNYDITRSYDEFIQRLFPAEKLSQQAFGRPDIPYKLIMCQQQIRFELNEAGVRLESQVVIIVGVTSLPPPPKHLTFNRPFLFLMKLRTADKPYFAMWIDNAELLGRAE